MTIVRDACQKLLTCNIIILLVELEKILLVTLI
jgi:hypothetical protein